MKKAVMGLVAMMAVSVVGSAAFAGVVSKGAPSRDIPNDYEPCKELARIELSEAGDIYAGGEVRLTNEPSRFAPVMEFDYEMSMNVRRNGRNEVEALGVTIAFNQFTKKCSVK